MPQIAIPDWFDHGCMGGTLSFSIRGKFLLIALAFFVGKAPAMGEVVNVMATAPTRTLPILEGLDAESQKELFEAVKKFMSHLQRQKEFISRITGVDNETEKARRLCKSTTVEVSLFVNGRPVIDLMQWTSQIIYSSSDPIVEGNALVCTPRRNVEEESWQELDALLAHDHQHWNDVVIQASCCGDSSSNLAVNCCAVHVYKPYTNMENIQFKCFDPNNNSANTMASMTYEPIKLKGSPEEYTILLLEGKFGKMIC